MKTARHTTHDTYMSVELCLERGGQFLGEQLQHRLHGSGSDDIGAESNEVASQRIAHGGAVGVSGAVGDRLEDNEVAIRRLGDLRAQTEKMQHTTHTETSGVSWQMAGGVKMTAVVYLTNAVAHLGEDLSALGVGPELQDALHCAGGVVTQCDLQDVAFHLRDDGLDESLSLGCRQRLHPGHVPKLLHFIHLNRSHKMHNDAHAMHELEEQFYE